MAEVVGHLRPEDPAGTAGVDGPIFDVLRVRPHEVAERTFVGDLDPAVNRADLVDRLDFGTKSAVDAEDLAWIKKNVPSMTAPMGR